MFYFAKHSVNKDIAERLLWFYCNLYFFGDYTFLFVVFCIQQSYVYFTDRSLIDWEIIKYLGISIIRYPGGTFGTNS